MKLEFVGPPTRSEFEAWLISEGPMSETSIPEAADSWDGHKPPVRLSAEDWAEAVRRLEHYDVDPQIDLPLPPRQ